MLKNWFEMVVLNFLIWKNKLTMKMNTHLRLRLSSSLHKSLISINCIDQTKCESKINIKLPLSTIYHFKYLEHWNPEMNGFYLEYPMVYQVSATPLFQTSSRKIPCSVVSRYQLHLDNKSMHSLEWGWII